MKQQYIQPAILVVELDLEGNVAQVFSGSKVRSINPTNGVDISFERETKMGIYTDDFGNTWVDGAK